MQIVHQQIPYGDYLQTILTARIGGQTPDILHVYSIWAAQLVHNGILAAPPEETLAFIRDNYVANTVDAVTIQGQVWGIPTEVSNYLLVYNKRLLQEAGYDAPPSTWDELLEIAEATTERDAQGRLTRAGFAFGPTVANVVHPYLTLLYSKGVDLFTEDFSATNLTTPEAIEALEQQVRLFEAGVADFSLPVAEFQAGDVAMTIQAVWTKGGHREAFGEAFEETVGVAPIPMGDAWRSLQYAFFYGVDAGSPNQDEAWRFLEWLNTAQEAGETSCMGAMLVDLGALTANTTDIEAAQDELGDAFSAPFVEALARSVTEPNVIQAAEIQAILQTYIERAWRGELSPEAALTQADQEISTILAEFY